MTARDGERVSEGEGVKEGVRAGAARLAPNVGGIAVPVARPPCAAPDAVQALQARTAMIITNNIQPGFNRSPIKDCATV